MRLWLLYIAAGVLLFISPSCGDEDPFTGDCYVPNVGVNEVINMNLPSYFHLQDLGSHIYLNSGHRGIFLVHNYDDIFYALERTCTYQSDNECAQVAVDSTTLRLKCGQYVDTGFVVCCGSEYLFDGRVVQGPSRCGLKPFRVNVQDNHVFINN
jgi:nitrite reductase/ring-hydroxylating ferredoxin subunit